MARSHLSAGIAAPLSVPPFQVDGIAIIARSVSIRATSIAADRVTALAIAGR